MKKIFGAVILVFLLFISVEANATEIAVIDIEKIIESSKAMRSVNKTLTDKKNQIQKELRQEESELNAKKEDIRSKQSILSQDALEKKTIEFQQDVLNFQKKVKSKEDMLQKAYMEAVLEVTDEVKVIVEELKAEGKFTFDIAISSPMVIYANNNLDISADVLKRLNQRLKTVNVSI